MCVCGRQGACRVLRFREELSGTRDAVRGVLGMNAARTARGYVRVPGRNGGMKRVTR